MGLFITDKVGLIIASCNTVTFILMIYLFAGIVAKDRSRVFMVLDKIFKPVLFPIRRIVPQSGFDFAPLVLALILQVVVFTIKRGTG